MKKAITLAAATALFAAGALSSAQAQIVLDGRLTAAEITAGNYRLIGKFTNPRGFGDAGLISLYAGSSATKMFFFVGGTVETNGNAFQLYLDLPATPGVPVGTSLPGGSAGTSFQNVTAKLDLAADVALALRSDGPDFKIEGATYGGVAGAYTASSQNLNTGPVAGSGTPTTLAATLTTAGYARFAGARVAYRNTTAGGSVAANPGNTATPATYGGVGTTGWEIEINRASAGLTAGTSVTMFVIQNGGDGGYMSTDFIPQTSSPLPSTSNNGNLATGAFDFTTLPDLQAATVTLGAVGLGTKSENEAAVAMTVFPNPSLGQTTVNYRVLASATPVAITVTDLMGRVVKNFDNGLQSAGTQNFTLNTTDLAAGTYLVKVQAGDKASTRKVVLL